MRIDVRAVANVVGLESLAGKIEDTDSLRLALCTEPLRVDALERVCHLLVPYRSDLAGRVRNEISPFREHSELLSPPECDWVLRVAALLVHVLEVWQEPEAGRDFLFEPHPLLKNALPAQIGSRCGLGAELVHDILGRLQHGSVL